METSSGVNQKLDNRAIQVKTVCLSTPVILRQILEQFSNSELIKLSRVNKQWNYEARCVLRDRGTLAAKIETNGPVCQALVIFASHLKKMRVVPFSGINVRLHHIYDCQSKFNGSLDPIYKVILERLPCKHLSLEFRVNWEECRDCQALALVQEICNNFSGALEILSITFDWDEVEPLLKFFLNPSFPRLKTLKLETEYTDPDLPKFVKALVSSAPNLKELQIAGDIDYFAGNFLEGSSAVLVPCADFNPLWEQVCESLIGALRPQTIEIYLADSVVDLNPDLLNRVVPLVLQASITSLKTLRLDLLFAVPLMCYGICLENVTTLEIRLDYNAVEYSYPESPILIPLLKGFDFTRVFPKLNQIEIESNAIFTVSPEQISEFFERANAILKDPLRGRAGSIKSLLLRGAVVDSSVEFLAKIFPNVTTLLVERGEFTWETPFTSLWDHLKNLKELTFTNYTQPKWVTNLDSVFCGIFPEEVAQLREKDDEYLKAVNIVPVMPSITCLKELRTFTFRYTPAQETDSVWGTDTSFLFSKVTGLLAFERCRALAVTFQTASSQCAEALGHMKPFASFVSIDTRSVESDL